MKTVIAQYKDLVRWDVKSFLVLGFGGGDGNTLLPVGEFLEQRKEEFSGSSTPTMLSIHFGGSISERPVKDIKGKLFLARSGDFVFSKIDARNGALCMIPDQYEEVAFTAEFPIYMLKDSWKDRVSLQYLELVLLSPSFLQILNALVSGASGRKRITPDQFENVKIPIPDIKMQQKIVADFQKAKTQAEKLQSEADQKEKQIDEFLMRELGIEKTEHIKKNGAFVVNYKDLERWDVDYFVNSYTQYTSKNFVPLQTAIDKFCSTKILPKKNTEYFYVGMEHIEKSTGRYSYVSTNDNPVKSQSLVLQKDYVYYAKLRPYLNKAFLFDKESGQFIATSELLGFYPKKEADHKFILSILLSDVVLDQIKNLMVGARMPRISEKDFKNLQIVLPPLKTQKAIVAKIEKMRTEVQKLRSQSADILETARERLQRAIVKN